MTDASGRAARVGRAVPGVGPAAVRAEAPYVLVLLVVLAVGSALVPATWQGRLVALGCALAAYGLCVRWGAWRWLAALSAVPALVSPLVLATTDVSSAVRVLLVSAGLLALCWQGRPGPAALGAAALAVVAAAAAPPVLAGPDAPTGALPVGSLVPLGIAAMLALAAALGAGRAGPAPLRLACLALFGVPLLVSLVAAAVGGDTLPIVLWWPAAGVFGLTALLRGRRGRAAARPQADEVDDAAVRAFDARHGNPRLAPVVVVIAAFEEEAGLPAVLASMPATVCDLPLDVLVVDDGSGDSTADVAEASGRAHVVRCGVNRGQGRALRLGYRIARGHGARYVLTTDADGQYDVGDLPTALAPLLEDRADFVTGSRRLGHQQTRDRVRRLGVHVFAWLVSGLVGHHVTDTSFGLRAMRAEVTASVTLNQPQYQSSELMIGAFSRGFRVLEIPGTMHARGAGTTKKGRNLVYGRRYAGVVLGTWWREGCPAPVTGSPALRAAESRTRA